MQCYAFALLSACEMAELHKKEDQCSWRLASSLHLTPCHPHLATSAQDEETLLLNHTFGHLGPGRTNAVINHTLEKASTYYGEDEPSHQITSKQLVHSGPPGRTSQWIRSLV